MGSLNALRREALEALTLEREKHLPRRENILVPNQVPFPDPELDFHANVFNNLARRFYSRHGAEVLEPAFETLPDPDGREVMTTRYCLRHQLDLCLKTRAGRLLKDPWRIRDQKHEYRLVFDCTACRMKVILEGPARKRT